jgi:hypothetical protein
MLASTCADEYDNTSGKGMWKFSNGHQTIEVHARDNRNKKYEWLSPWTGDILDLHEYIIEDILVDGKSLQEQIPKKYS